MGKETRWPRSAVSFDTLPSQKGGLHPARSGVYTEEEVGGRAVLCDCHCGPMYYFPVSLNAQEGLCNVLGIRVWAAT
jgi:hypothetical protein